MKSLNSDTTIIFSANIGEIIFYWGIVLIVAIAYYKYASEHWEKAKNQFTYVNPYLKELWFQHPTQHQLVVKMEMYQI